MRKRLGLNQLTRHHRRAEQKIRLRTALAFCKLLITVRRYDCAVVSLLASVSRKLTSQSFLEKASQR